MIKIISCAIAFILLLSSVLMHFFIDKKDDFILTLNDKQKKIYKSIIIERFRIYIFGMMWLLKFTGWEKLFLVGAQPFLLAELFKVLILTIVLPKILKFRNF